MSDEPTLGELGRLIQALRGDMRDDLAQLNTRLDKVVPMDVYTVEKNQITDRVTALESQREKDAERMTATRRWLIGAVVLPLVGILLPIVVIFTRGAGT